MPLPFRNVRYRFKKISSRERQRLAFAGKKVVEVTGYRKRKNNKWVEEYTRKFPEK